MRDLTDDDIRPLAQEKYEERQAKVIALGLIVAGKKVAAAALHEEANEIQGEIDKLCAEDQAVADWCAAKEELETSTATEDEGDDTGFMPDPVEDPKHDGKHPQHDVD